MPTTHTIKFKYTAGSTLYAYSTGYTLDNWDTGTPPAYMVLATEGTGADTGLYSIALDSQYGNYWALFAGTTQPTSWEDAFDPLLSLALPTEASGTSDGLSAPPTYAKDDVRGPRVWTWPRRPRTVRSPVIVQVHPSFDGTLAFDLKNILNHKAGIDSITSVTVSPSGPTITGPNGEADPAKDSSNTMVLFDIDGGQADDTDYTFTCTVTTTDSDSALVVTGVMQCRD